jgi:aryl-alcohol dehydrogenase-like predicted oxidoreductase
VFTKCGMVWGADRRVGFRLKRDSVRRECEASLQRLKVDVLDLYQIHWPKPAVDIEEGWTELARLREEGKVRWIGVSNFDVGHLERAEAIAPSPRSSRRTRSCTGGSNRRSCRTAGTAASG